MAKFIVVDDHPLAVMAIKALLESNGHQVVATSGESENVLALIAECAPDALVIDIELPGQDGLELLKSIRQHLISLPVIVMSGKNAEHYAMECKRYGANGFLSKNNELEDLSIAVRAVMSGYGYFPLRINNTTPHHGTLSDGDKIRALSSREFQVLKYLGQGIDIIDIAARLDISNKTVSTYKARLMEKLELRNQKDLLNFTRLNHIS